MYFKIDEQIDDGCRFIISWAVYNIITAQIVYRMGTMNAYN